MRIRDYQNQQVNIYRYYAMNHPFYEMNPHTHPEWEIMYVVHGKCRIGCMIDGKERIYDLRDGEYVLIEGGVPHDLTVEKENPCRVLNLEGRVEAAAGGSCLRFCSEDSAVVSFCADTEPVLAGTDDGRLHDILRSLIQELKETPDYFITDSNPMLNLLLGQFFLTIARQRQQARRHKGEQSVYCRKAQDYIEENFDQEITVADVATAVGISEGYLQRLYKKEKGFPIMEEILELRIDKAKNLLENSTLPVIDIAVNVGFNSRQHFSAMFTRMTGCSPMMWRKRKGNISAYEGFAGE